MVFKGGTPPNRKTYALLDYEKPNSSYKKLLLEIGELMRETRRGQGHSQKYISKKLGMSQGTISRFEEGTGVSMSLWPVWRVADFLGYDVHVTLVKKKKRVRHASSKPIQEATASEGVVSDASTAAQGEG